MQSNIERIRKLNREYLISYVGEIDEQVFQIDDANILYYLFPLIEKTVLEILKLYSFSDVEILRQGIYRTLFSLINQSKNRKHFTEALHQKLELYYSETGLRNTLMHYSPVLDELKIPIVELNNVRELSIQLLEKLNRKILSSEISVFEKIELL